MAVYRRLPRTSYAPRRFNRRYQPTYGDASSQALFWMGLVVAVLVVAASGLTKLAPSLEWSTIIAIIMAAVVLLSLVAWGLWLLWQQYRRQTYLNLKLEQIDQLDGFEFEKYLAVILSELGYQNVRRTPDTNDHGVDLIFEADGVRYAAQLKRSKWAIGVSALYQGAGGRDYYQADRVVVITNNYFTHDAQKHARQTGYWLVDRNGLKEWLDSLSTSKNSPSAS